MSRSRLNNADLYRICARWREEENIRVHGPLGRKRIECRSCGRWWRGQDVEGLIPAVEEHIATPGHQDLMRERALIAGIADQIRTQLARQPSHKNRSHT